MLEVAIRTNSSAVMENLILPSGSPSASFLLELVIQVVDAFGAGTKRRISLIVKDPNIALQTAG